MGQSKPKRISQTNERCLKTPNMAKGAHGDSFACFETSNWKTENAGHWDPFILKGSHLVHIKHFVHCIFKCNMYIYIYIYIYLQEFTCCVRKGAHTCLAPAGAVRVNSRQSHPPPPLDRGVLPPRRALISCNFSSDTTTARRG